MELKGWRDIPIGRMILGAGNAVEYLTGGWRHGADQTIELSWRWIPVIGRSTKWRTASGG
jgi:hypothetical protein